jgi:Spy/CpxP family protein refolding chaperone
MRKNKLLILVAVIVASNFAVLPTYAWQNNCKTDKAKGGLEAKFLSQTEFLSDHQEMLNLNDAQIKQIKDLSIATKKDLIRNNAEIEITLMDIESNLFDSDKIDLKVMEKLIDQKYKLKKDIENMLVKAFAQVQNILTPEQIVVLKDLDSKGKQPYSKSMKGFGEQPYSKTMKCPVAKPMGMCPRMKAPEAMSK